MLTFKGVLAEIKRAALEALKKLIEKVGGRGKENA